MTSALAYYYGLLYLFQQLIDLANLTSPTPWRKAVSNIGFIPFFQYFSLLVNFHLSEYSISVNKPYNEEMIIR